MLTLSKKYFGEKHLEDATEVTNKYFGKKESEGCNDDNPDEKMEATDADRMQNENQTNCSEFGCEEEVEQKNEDPANAVSIDVTKALLLLGVNCWSNFEPAHKKGNVEHAEQVLSKAMELKLQERREYLDLMEETKEINFNLYLKMVQAEETRTVAFAQKGNPGKNTKSTNLPEKMKLPDVLKAQVRPLRRAKSTRQPRVTKKWKSTKETVVEETDKVAEHDEEEIALAWAYSVLMKEFYRRNELRGKTVTTKKKVNDKLEALWRFRKLKEKKKTEERKKTKERKTKDMMKTVANVNTISSLQNGESASKKDAKCAEEGNDLNVLKKKGSFKRKVQVINLQDQILSKRKPGDDGGNPLAKDQHYKVKTEEEKVEEAQRVLRYLKERQRLRDQLDSLGNKRKDKNENIESTSKSGQEENDVKEGESNAAEMGDVEMKPSSNASSNATSAASSRKGSKKKLFSRLKIKVKRTASDPVENKNRNLLAVQTPHQNHPSVGSKSSLLPRKQLSRATSAPYGGKSKTSPQSRTRNANSRELSRKSSTSSTISRMTDEDSNDSAQFASFVKKSLHDSGIISSKEDEDVVNDAIEKTLFELSDGSANSSLHSSMLQIVDGSVAKDELDQRNPDRFQKLRELASFNDDDISLDNVNLAEEEIVEVMQKDDSNHSGTDSQRRKEEERRDSTDTFYSLKEESEESADEKFSDLDEISEEDVDSKKSVKSDSKSSDSISFKNALKL